MNRLIRTFISFFVLGVALPAFAGAAWLPVDLGQRVQTTAYLNEQLNQRFEVELHICRHGAATTPSQ